MHILRMNAQGLLTLGVPIKNLQPGLSSVYNQLQDVGARVCLMLHYIHH